MSEEVNIQDEAYSEAMDEIKRKDEALHRAVAEIEKLHGDINQLRARIENMMENQAQGLRLRDEEIKRLSEATPVVSDSEILRAYSETIRLRDKEIERLKADIELLAQNEIFHKAHHAYAADALVWSNNPDKDLIYQLREAAKMSTIHKGETMMNDIKIEDVTRLENLIAEKDKEIKGLKDDVELLAQNEIYYKAIITRAVDALADALAYGRLSDGTLIVELRKAAL